MSTEPESTEPKPCIPAWTKHHYCRSKVIPATEIGGRPGRAYYCCWCGEDRPKRKPKGAPTDHA